jgi:hypothetical protein
MTLRELMTEYILFAFDEQELMQKFQVTEDELADMSDIDLLEIYDQTLLTPVKE